MEKVEWERAEEERNEAGVGVSVLDQGHRFTQKAIDYCMLSKISTMLPEPLSPILCSALARAS